MFQSLNNNKDHDGRRAQAVIYRGQRYVSQVCLVQRKGKNCDTYREQEIEEKKTSTVNKRVRLVNWRYIRIFKIVLYVKA